MNTPIATYTGYLEHAVPTHEITSDSEMEEPHTPVVHTPSTPSQVQRDAVEEVVEVITLTSMRSIKQGEVELETGDAESVSKPTDTQTLSASDKESFFEDDDEEYVSENESQDENENGPMRDQMPDATHRGGDDAEGMAAMKKRLETRWLHI